VRGYAGLSIPASHECPCDAELTPLPTVLDFHNSTAFIKGLTGPPGGGKSVGTFMEAVLRAMRQLPDKEGMRKFRVGIARATYPKLHMMTLKTVKDWVPGAFGGVRYTAPIEGLYGFRLPDHTTVDSKCCSTP
jgi:hypothetical protein